MLTKELTIILWNYILFCNGAIIPVYRQGKLSLIEWTNYNYREPEGYGTYAFGYDVEDPDTNNIQFRNEEKLSNGSVVGSYGYLESSGNAFVVRYIADEGGYRAIVEDSKKLKNLFPLFRLGNVRKTSDYTDTETKKIYTNSRNVKNEALLQTIRPIVSTSEINVNNMFHRENIEQNHIEEKNNDFYIPQHIQTNLYSEMNGNEQNEINRSTEKYPDPNFSTEEESNSFYYPQNILESPDFHRKKENNDKIVFQEKKGASEKKIFFRKRHNDPIQNVPHRGLNSLNNIAKNYFEYTTNEDNARNSSVKFKRDIQYSLDTDSSSFERKTEEDHTLQEGNDKNFIMSKSNMSENLKKHIQNQRNSKETVKGARIVIPEVNNPSPLAHTIYPCTGFQKSDNKYWYNKDNVFLTRKNQMKSQLISATLRSSENERNKKELENAQLENKLKTFRIVTPDQISSSPLSTIRPCI